MKRIALVALLIACTAPDPVPGTPLEAVARSALNCPAGALTWSVVEPGGGSVTSAGVYTPPPCSASWVDATFHVAVSGCGNSTQIPVDVADAVRSLAIYCGVVAPETCCRPPPFVVAPGTAIQMYARVTFSCAEHVVYTQTPPAFCP